jgi:PAS domain S-box-containing protein
MRPTSPESQWASVATDSELLMVIGIRGHGDERELFLLHANDLLCAALGYEPHELIGKPTGILTGRAGSTPSVEGLRTFLNRESKNPSLFMQSKSGETVRTQWNGYHLDDPEHGHLLVSRGTLVDRRDASNEAAREIISAVEHVSDAVIIYEMSADRIPRVNYANRAAERLTGYSRDELETASRVGPLTDRESRDAMLDAIQRGESVHSRQRLYRKDGTAYWADLQMRPLLDSTVGRWRWSLVERDITDVVEREGVLESERELYATLAAAAEAFLDADERPLLEEAYASARERLSAAGRRDAITILTAMHEVAVRRLTLFAESVARRNEVVETQAAQADVMAMLVHDLRGPLNTIVGYAELVSESAEPATETFEHMQLILRAAQRVTDLTSEVMVAAQLDRNEYRPLIEHIDLLALIRNIVALSPGNERIVFDFADPSIELEGDVSALRHIVANLAGNALKYSGKGTPVDIAVRAADGRVTIAFRDHGIGIPTDELAGMFERFSRASNAKASAIRGTGLGLYFVKQLVERNKGTIDIQSELGSGTTVIVDLPLVPLSTFAIPAVLSIQDESDDLSLIARELRGCGYVVYVAQSIAVAEGVLHRERVALVITDIDLFGDEASTAVRVAASLIGVPVLSLGVHCDSAKPLQLRSPFVAEDLVRKVQAIVPALAF